jgi:hypothetical protein
MSNIKVIIISLTDKFKDQIHQNNKITAFRNCIKELEVGLFKKICIRNRE